MWCVLVVCLLADSNMIECGDGTVVIGAIDDDYCDCADATDEPHTSACSTSPFSCTHTDARLPSTTFPSSRINDGVCDCCDGQDEPQGTCENRCDRILEDVREKLTTRVMLHLEGSKAKSEVDELGISHKRGFPKTIKRLTAEAEKISSKLSELSRSNPDFYPLYQQYVSTSNTLRRLQNWKSLKLKNSQSGWYELAQWCYRVIVNEKVLRGGSPTPGRYQDYIFELCPLDAVYQWEWDGKTVINDTVSYQHKEPGIQKTLIGAWEPRDLQQNVMIYDEGSGCPNGVQRNIQIEIRCGLQNRFVSVAEDGMCEYLGVFETPVACSVQVVRKEGEQLREWFGIAIDLELEGNDSGEWAELKTEL